MSFSSEQKEKIISSQYKSQCCRRAVLSGVLLTKAYLTEDTVNINISSDEIINFVSKLILEFYGKDAYITQAKIGGRAKTLRFESHAAVAYLKDLKNGKKPYTEKCSACKSAFFRGCFLVSGRVSDPDKQYLLEFSLADNFDIFINELADVGIFAKFNARKGENIIYIKKSISIEDFFVTSNMNQTAFRFMDAKINNELRNKANRLANCETNNIEKAVNASYHQISVIKELDSRGLLSSLPEELEKTARLRILHEELSLSALAKISIPPISKSGLSHRLNKIMEIGKNMLE